MLEHEDELDEEEDLPDPGDPLGDEEEEQADLDEPEEESDLEDLSVEQLLERDRVLQKDAESRSRQAAGDEPDEDEEPEERARPAVAPAQESRREELKKRYPRSAGLFS